jgi:hypothetical protein
MRCSSRATGDLMKACWTAAPLELDRESIEVDQPVVEADGGSSRITDLFGPLRGQVPDLGDCDGTSRRKTQLLFGIALYRARVLIPWAVPFVTVGGLITAAQSVVRDALYRILAWTSGIAMAALGYSLWHRTRTSAPAHRATPTPRLSTAGSA